MTLTHYELFLLKEVHERIAKDIHKPFDLIEILDNTQVSQRTFIRAYKTTYGKTPARHRLEVVMLYAKKRMEEGIQVKAIAGEVGYSNPENFSRAFKKIFGYRPSKLSL